MPAVEKCQKQPGENLTITMRSFFGFAVVLVVLSIAACSSRAFLESQREAFMAIERFNMLYLEAINDSDLELLGRLTTEEHVLVPGDDEPVTGKAALIETMRAVFERFDIKESWTTEEAIINGDMAFQRGTYTVLATPRGEGEVIESHGTFQRTYKRQDSGEWYMIIDRHSGE